MNSAQTSRDMSENIMRALCLTFSGAAIGWLIGLSISPILYIVVTSILTAAVAVVSALAGLEGADRDAKARHYSPTDNPASSLHPSPALAAPGRPMNLRLVTPVPLTFLLVGIVLGASIGTYVRSHDWLGADPQSLIRKWRITKLPDEEIAKRLFDQLYPPSTRFTSSEKSDTKDGGQDAKRQEIQPGRSAISTDRLTGGLFSAVPPEECKDFRSAPDKDLRRLMQASTNKAIRTFADRCNDTVCLRVAFQELLCADQQP